MRQALVKVQSRTLLWLLIALVLLARALVPAGYMPAFDGGDVLIAKVCNSAQPIAIDLGRDKEPPRTDHEESPCAFAGFGGDMPIAGQFAEQPWRIPAEQKRILLRAPLVLQRLARVLPPGRAPPITA